MKNLVVVIMLFAFAQGAHAVSEINTTLIGSVAIKGYDPVAYFTDSKPVKGEKKYTHKWKEANWRFASINNRDLFAADPEKYAPQYGGYCAYAVSQNSTANIDPTQWTIVDGKLYLNYNKKINQKWAAKRAEFITLADSLWPGLLKK